MVIVDVMSMAGSSDLRIIKFVPISSIFIIFNLLIVNWDQVLVSALEYFIDFP